MYEFIELDNGIKVCLYKMDSVKSVSLKAMITAGPVIEQLANRGASHFIEHIILDGTISYPTKHSFAEILESLGVSYNCYTSISEMGFEFDVPYPNIFKTIDILAEVLFHPVFDANQIEKERTVVLTEMQNRDNAPESKFYYASQKYRFKKKDHPLTWRVIGTKEIIQEISREELLKLYERLFVPSNMYVSLVGNFDMQEAIDYVQKRLGTYTKKEVFVRPRFDTADLSAQVIKTKQETSFSDVYASISFPCYGAGVPTITELTIRIFSAMFAGLRTSWLFQEVREKEGLVYGISSDWSGYWGVGDFSISFEADKQYLDRILEIVFANIQKAQKKGFSDKELDHMKNYLNNRTLLSFSNPWKITNWLMNYMFENEQVIFPEEIIALCGQVTHELVQDFISYVFDYEKMNVYMMGKLDGYNPKEKVLSLIQ